MLGRMLIGQLARETGVPARTIRFYEDEGILPQPSRSGSGYRDYDQAAVARLRFLRSAQKAGLTLSEIHSVLAIRDGGEAPCVHTRALLAARQAEVSDRIEELKRLRRELTRLMDAGESITDDLCDPVAICSIIPS